MNCPMSNADNPRLGIRKSLKKPISCSQDFVCNLKGSRFNVDCHNFAMIACFNLRSYLRLIERIASLGKLFLAISRLSNCHQFDLAALEAFPF